MPPQILGEMRETVPKEFDFLREAKLMRVIASRVRGAGLKGVVIPEPLLALTSPQLLVMQRMHGQPETLNMELDATSVTPLKSRYRGFKA